MPHLLKHNEIDFEKWNHCAKQTPNQMVYAFSWYLNAVTSHKWDAIIWGNYEAIMPLPWNKKLVKKQVYMPSGLQQVGAFGNASLVKSSDIINILEKHYVHYSISTAMPINDNAIARRNYILPLNEPYETIYGNYKKNRRYDSRQAKKFDKLRRLNLDEFLKFYCNEGREFIPSSVTQLKEFVTKCYQTGYFLLLGIEQNGSLCSVVGLTNYQQRLTLILSATNSRGQKQGANAVLLDAIFKTYSNKNYIFDFEGSEIEGVQNYFKSFGSVEKQYFVSSKKHFLYKIFKK